MNYIFDAHQVNPNVQIFVFTTQNALQLKTPQFPNTKIYRLGVVTENSVIRYASYFWFNFISSLRILALRPNFIVAFEILSLFPLWVIGLFYRCQRAHIHFHEYLSLPERQLSSVYMKLLFKIEDTLLNRYLCSHTNEDRKSLFLLDKPWLKSANILIRPNMPPKSWWLQYGQHKRPGLSLKTKLVYVGACDCRTMFVKEILEWIACNSDKFDLTIISQNIDLITRDLIYKYQGVNVKLLSPIDYYSLPKELVNYDIGLVLYKGVIPNHIYSVPNKVYEYLACGLRVICDKRLISVRKLNDERIFMIDFTKLNQESCLNL